MVVKEPTYKIRAATLNQ